MEAAELVDSKRTNWIHFEKAAKIRD